MTLTEQIITIGLCVLGTMATRFLPFIIFNEKRSAPKFVEYLGKLLPGAVFGMLIIYSLRKTDFTGGFHGLPELISIAVTAVLHLLKRNMLLSIAAGTACYMLLIAYVF